MSRLHRLLAEHCADGVSFEPLSQVGTWYGGGTPSKSRLDFWREGTIPWLSPKDMGAYIVDETEDHITQAAVVGSATKLVPANSIALVVRSSILDRILPTALVPIPITMNQDMKAVLPREDIMPEYLAHLLRTLGPELLRTVRKTGGSVTSIDVPKLMKVKIPVPPPAVQQELVLILDKITRQQGELEAELEAELEHRSRQYAYYRDSLLTFAERDRVRWAKLGDVGRFIRGKRFTKADYEPDGIGCIHYGEIYTHFGTSATKVVSHLRPEIRDGLRYAEPGDVVIVDVGETVVDVGKAVAWIGDEPVAIHDHSYAYRHELNPSYVSYVMQTGWFIREKLKYIARTKVNTLMVDGFSKIEIPIPERDEQNRIVSILDRFDALVCDLSIGLPAEIAARREQYQYYRHRLLTFEEAA